MVAWLERICGTLRAPSCVTHGQVNKAYWPHIDGLRAVAIISVVGFHVGLPGFPGGFIGVDVFFVISGYLITTLLLRELRASGSIDLLAFFARRVRRLFPAFSVVVIATLLLGSYFLLPIFGEQQRLADSASAAALYLSNLYFGWSGDAYFDPDSSLYPLLHTWSLAVEEQFYLLWPMILLGAMWVARRMKSGLTWTLVGLLTFLIAASLGYNLWAWETGPRETRLAFFALHARAWELGIGALLALALPQLQRSDGWPGVLLITTGIIGIGTAVVFFHDEMPFVGIATLLPTLSAAAIIAGVWLTPNATTAKMLMSRPFVVIGLLSYSWYLWHWPLMAITRAHTLGVVGLWRDTAIAIASLGLAWLTYVFVEQPVRTRRVGPEWSSLRVLTAGAAASLLILASAQGLRVRATELAKVEPFQQLAGGENDLGWSRKDCRHSRSKFHGLIPESECMGSTARSSKLLVVWGDSHADHLVGMLETADKARPFALLPRWMAACPPLVGVLPIKDDGAHTPRDEACARFNSEVLTEIDQLQRQGRLVGVVLGANWQDYADKSVLFPNPDCTRGDAVLAPLVSGLRCTLAQLTSRKIKILVVAPIPRQEFDVPFCLARRPLEYCSMSRKVAENRRKVSLNYIEQATEGLRGVLVWDALPALCHDSRCPAMRDGVIMYRDKEHLTYTGSRLLGSYLQRSFSWQAMAGEEPAAVRRVR